MIRIAILAAAAALLLAGCSAAPVANDSATGNVTVATADASGWDRAFRPDVAVDAANQFGFRASPYQVAGTEYRTQGGPVMLSNSFDKKPNQIAFKGYGVTADRLDAMSFDLTINDVDNAVKVRKHFANIVRDVLFQSKIDASAVHDAIAKGEAAKGDLAGTYYQVIKTPKQGAEHLTVTFNRTGASAPANS